MSYILAVHVPIAGMALLPVLLGWRALLYPMHIAFLELIIYPACSLAFENEPPESDMMQRPPRDAEAPLFGGATCGWRCCKAWACSPSCWVPMPGRTTDCPENEARAFAFATLVVDNLALIFSNRSGTRSLWASLRTPNRTQWVLVGLALVLLLGALYLPWAVGVLRFAPLPAHELAVACALGSLSMLWFEGAGRIPRERRRR